MVLNDGEMKIMITGRDQIRITDNAEFDYIGCIYPDGVDGENVVLFRKYFNFRKHF